MSCRYAMIFTVCLGLSATVAAGAPATGLAINLSLVGRLTGGGGVLYRTAVDVTNNATAPVQIDYYIDGVDSVTGTSISAVGSLGATGLTAQGSATLPGRVSIHFDDIVQALADAKAVSSDVITHGFIGSAMFIFNGATKSGSGSVTARFYNSLGTGTVGVALKGHEILVDEPQTLTATIQDTRGNPAGTPEIYTNVFLNNTGLTRDGAATAEAVTIEVTAYSARTGQPIGTAATVTLAPGKTASLSTASFGLGAAQPRALIVARVISGKAAIEGLVSQVDSVTKDGSAFEMSRGD